MSPPTTSAAERLIWGQVNVGLVYIVATLQRKPVATEAYIEENTSRKEKHDFEASSYTGVSNYKKIYNNTTGEEMQDRFLIRRVYVKV